MARGLVQALALSGATALTVGSWAPAAYAADHGDPGSGSSRGSGSSGHTHAAADPAGNNGTIKIDDLPADAQRSNRPHPGCDFALKFFDFDSDQRADITFTGQAPTALGTLKTYKDQLISTTPADGSMEADHTLVLSASDLGLLGKPQAKQGWHVKVSVDVLDAPGGAKHKVFWLKCPAPPAAVGSGTTTDSSSTPGTQDTGSGGIVAGSPGTPAVPGTADVPGTDSSSGLGSGSVTTSSGASSDAAAVTGTTNGSGSAALAVTPPQASTAGGGSGLPFTGLPLPVLLTAAGAATALGVAALRAGRRTRPHG